MLPSSALFMVDSLPLNQLFVNWIKWHYEWQYLFCGPLYNQCQCNKHVVSFILSSVIQKRRRSKICRLSKCRGASLWSLEPQMTGEGGGEKSSITFRSSYLSTTDKSGTFRKGRTEKTPNGNLVEFKINKNLILTGWMIKRPNLKKTEHEKCRTTKWSNFKTILKPIKT